MQKAHHDCQRSGCPIHKIHQKHPRPQPYVNAKHTILVSPIVSAESKSKLTSTTQSMLTKPLTLMLTIPFILFYIYNHKALFLTYASTSEIEISTYYLIRLVCLHMTLTGICPMLYRYFYSVPHSLDINTTIKID